MRKVLLAALLCLLPDLSEAQTVSACPPLCFYPPKVAGTSGGGATFTAPVLLSNGTSGAPALSYASDTDLGFFRGGANDFAIAAGGTDYHFISSAFTGTASADIGSPTYPWKVLFHNRSTVGSLSKTLADNTKATFATMSLQTADSYTGGDIIWTLYCADASDRVTRSGRLPWAAQTTGGTTTCAVGTTSSSGDVTNNGKAFSSVTFTCADATGSTVQLEVQADCSIVTPTTLLIWYRFDIPYYSFLTAG